LSRLPVYLPAAVPFVEPDFVFGKRCDLPTELIMLTSPYFLFD